MGLGPTHSPTSDETLSVGGVLEMKAMLPFCRSRLLPIFGVFFVLLAQSVLADAAKEEKAEPEFTRLSRDDDGEALALEAAIVRYAPADSEQAGPIVDLVSAVHVGEGAYYEELNRRFQQYDAVLYELVAPQGTVVPKGGPKSSASTVSMLQTTMTEVLKLQFQLNCVDYTAKNFVHADMTPRQFSESMRNRGESVFKVFMRMLGHAMSEQADSSRGSDLRLLFALFDKNRALALKRVLAEEFENMETSVSILSGPDGSTLITERNKVALGVLKKQVEAGRKKIAIFYGAGHMADIGQRLEADFGLRPKETTWLVAWDLKGSEKTESKPAETQASGVH